MKKGFTLIELLIIMVIVGILVTVALPQYRRSAERGRAAIGLAAIRQIADRTNAWYIVHDNTYPPNQATIDNGIMGEGAEVAGVGANNLFTGPIYDRAEHSITLTRNNSSGWYYKLSVTLANGEISGNISCAGTSGSNDCAVIGL